MEPVEIPQGVTKGVDRQALDIMTLKNTSPPRIKQQQIQMKKKENETSSENSENKKKDCKCKFTLVDVILFAFGLYGSYRLGQDLGKLVMGLFQKVPDLEGPIIIPQ